MTPTPRADAVGAVTSASNRGGATRTRGLLLPKRRSTRLSYAPSRVSVGRAAAARRLRAVSEAPLPVEPAAHRRPRVGYAMAASAAILWAVNGTVSKVILGSDFSSLRLLEVRSLGAAIGFVLVLLVIAPARLAATRRELPFLAVFGICGLAFVQWFYFLAIHRLAVGIALLIEYLGALLVALWARYVFHEHVRRRIWVALALALVGLAMIVDLSAAAASSRRSGSSSPRSRRSPTRPTSCSPSAASATATPSRCSPGASASPRSSSP